MAIVERTVVTENASPDSCESIVKKPLRRRSKMVTWVKRIAVGMLLVILLVSLFLKILLDRIEQDASELAEIGTSLNEFLGQYGAALKDRNIDSLMALHEEAYRRGNLRAFKSYTSQEHHLSERPAIPGLESLLFAGREQVVGQQYDQGWLASLIAIIWPVDRHVEPESQSLY